VDAWRKREHDVPPVVIQVFFALKTFLGNISRRAYKMQPLLSKRAKTELESPTVKTKRFTFFVLNVNPCFFVETGLEPVLG
jgi:hypothetical protein